ncbi:MAG: chemotaxis protein methyltransferase CheR [Frankiaceae bacterium]|jgi:chemotaxis protein methyltransferase CheR|nr:chemotaxis protein methyltransferase CheR [Frankiaceae bacterium]
MNRVVLTDAEFTALATLLHDAAGLTFDESRRESLSYSVTERIRMTGCPDVPSYLDLLRGGDEKERQALLDEVTIPETHFFRNPPQIRALRKYVLPEILRAASTTKRLRIWSAGCSTGEEPYTIAMLIRELLPAAAGWDVQIIATDVSNRALAAARNGRYSERSFVMTDPVDLQRFFTLDTNARSWQIRDEIREMVEFRHHNLVTELPPFDNGQLDVVFCRNVTIYFDRDTTKALMRRLHSCLRDGGYLFLGHAETLWQVTDAFSLVSLGDAFVYRRQPEDAERRRVLPDRRTEEEPRPTRADRRRGPLDRRGAEAAVREPIAPSKSRLRPPPVVPPPTKPARSVPRHAAPGTPDPLVAVRAAVAAGRYAEAADLAGECGVAQPLRAEAHYLHGLALTNLGRDGEALVVLRKAVYLDPQDGFAHFLLGGALERCHEPVAAARSYRAAAATLGGRPLDAVAPELGGRSVAELATTCVQLAQRIELSHRGGRP